MGPLRLKTIRNTGIRSEPTLDSRVSQYKTFLDVGGTIIHSDRIIVGVRGGGLAIVTAIPEVLKKKCQRMGVKYKRSDVVIVVDMIIKVKEVLNSPSDTPAGYVDYVRNNSGKQLQRTILLSNVVLPVLDENSSRSTVISCLLLPPSERVNGLDVHRLKLSDIEVLVERENEIFNILE